MFAESNISMEVQRLSALSSDDESLPPSGTVATNLSSPMDQEMSLSRVGCIDMLDYDLDLSDEDEIGTMHTLLRLLWK